MGRKKIQYPPSKFCAGIIIDVGIGVNKYSTELGELILAKGELGTGSMAGQGRMELHHGSGFHLVVRSGPCLKQHEEIKENIGMHYVEDVSPSGKPCSDCWTYCRDRLKPDILPRLLKKSQKTRLK